MKILKNVAKYGFGAIAWVIFIGGIKIYYLFGGKFREVEDAAMKCGLYDD